MSAKTQVDAMTREEQVALCQRIGEKSPRDWKFFITDQYETIFNMANIYAQNRRYDEDDRADWFGYVYDRLCDGRRLGQFQGKSKLYTYLYRRGSGVVYRLFLDWLRSRREEFPGGELVETVHSRDNPETRVQERAVLQRVEQEAQKLTPVRRIAFLVPEYTEALLEDDYRFLAEVNGAAPDQMDTRVAEMKERVAFIVEKASTDEELTCLLFPGADDIVLHERSTDELREMAQGLEEASVVELLHHLELAQLLRKKPDSRRINNLHSARRYARSRIRDAVGRSK